MTSDENNGSNMAAHRVRLGRESSHSRRADAERARWLEIWNIAWEMEAKRRGKCLSLSERSAFAARFRELIATLKERHGSRSARLGDILTQAADSAADKELARARGCPRNLLRDFQHRPDERTDRVTSKNLKALRQPDYRIDRFTSENPKALRGKLLDWLWVAEALAQALGRDPRREVIYLYDEARLHAPVVGRQPAGLADEYEAIFASLAARLNAIAADVARRHEAAAYYECCDKLHAAWHNGEVIEADGWATRFNRFEFADGGWVNGDDGPYFEDPCARSVLGPVGELIIHTPLARVSLCFVDVDEPLREAGISGEWASIELDVHLAIRPDADDPRQAGALMLHPFVASYDESLGREELPSRWWRAFPQIAHPIPDDQCTRVLTEAIPPPPDQHHERAIRLAVERLGQIRLLPLTGEACQAWLSFGANPLEPLFDPFFWAGEPWDLCGEDAKVSAPVGTLAGHVQYNLAMAAAADKLPMRLDQLLEADAVRKVTALRATLAAKREGYERLLLEAPGLASTEEQGE